MLRFPQSMVVGKCWTCPLLQHLLFLIILQWSRHQFLLFMLSRHVKPLMMSRNWSAFFYGANQFAWGSPCPQLGLAARVGGTSCGTLSGWFHCPHCPHRRCFSREWWGLEKWWNHFDCSSQCARKETASVISLWVRLLMLRTFWRLAICLGHASVRSEIYWYRSWAIKDRRGWLATAAASIWGWGGREATLCWPNNRHLFVRKKKKSKTSFVFSKCFIAYVGTIEAASFSMTQSFHISALCALNSSSRMDDIQIEWIIYVGY